jgi:hypothetical protein
MDVNKILSKLIYIFDCLWMLLGVIVILKLFGYHIESLEMYEFMILKIFVIGCILYVGLQISRLK